MASVFPRVYSWGANSYGQLAQGHKDDVLEPREVTELQHKVVSITGGGGHTLALTEAGTLLSCGSNDKGQLCHGQSADITTFIPVSGLEHNQIVKTAGGWDFSLGLTAEGHLYSWGSNAFGQLGRPTQEKHMASPVQINFADHEMIADMSAGLRHAVAITASGKIFTWGQGRRGQLGVENQAKVSKMEQPIEVILPGSVLPKQSVAGSYHTAVVTVSGDVYVWGCNKYGQTTLPSDTVSQQTVPHCVPQELFGGRQVTSLHSGWTHLLACTDDDCVYSWGRADYGQLGRSSAGSHDHIPQPIKNIHHVQALACGSEHSLAIHKDGQLMSWGWNEHGMCATGDEVNVKLPHQVAALRDCKVSRIGCGAGHCFVILSEYSGRRTRHCVLQEEG